jgi:hypothetical protein
MKFESENEKNIDENDNEYTEEDVEKQKLAEKFEHLPYVIKLKYPLKMGKRKIEEITILRRLKAKDVSQVQANNVTFGAISDLIAAITEESIGIIRELDISDFAQCSEAVTYFLSGFQVTGGKNS